MVLGDSLSQELDGIWNFDVDIETLNDLVVQMSEINKIVFRPEKTR